jgi:hypothetical protein
VTTLTPTRAARPARAPVAQRGRATESSPSLFDGAGGGPTLDELLAGVWEGLTAHDIVECPVCRGDMEPEYGAHALPIGGRCRACDTTLA